MVRAQDFECALKGGKLYSVRAYRFRLKVLLILAGICYTVVVGRLVYLQILQEDFYKGEAVKRRIRTTKTEPSRGVIYDSTGHVLAYSYPCFNLCVPYKTMVEVEPDTGKVHISEGPWLTEVMELTHLTRKEVIERAMEIVKRVERIRQLSIERYMRRYRRPPPRTHRIREELEAHTIVENVEFQTVARVETRLTGSALRIEAHSRRRYPLGRTAAHIIGYTGPVTAEEVERYGDFYDGSPYKAYQESDYVGRMGVEEQYNSALRGARGEVIEEITLNRSARRKVLERPAVQGANLYLTIDKDVQVAAENALGKQTGAFIVMRPENGAILAMASYPRFDPNTFRQDFEKLAKDPRSPLLHRAIQALVPPGSLFKQVTTCAALETQAITPHTNYVCPGVMRLGSISFRCWHVQGHGQIDLEHAIMYSCNCYFFQTGRAVGGNALVHWAKIYELGQRTGIDLPGEAAGLVPQPRKGAMGDIYNMAIGQGKLLVTPIQMARMMAVVANGGFLVRPHVLLKVTDQNGVVLRVAGAEKEFQPKPLPISKETLRLLRSALRRVMTEGTASNTAEAPYLQEAGVAGKTGTAETANPEVNHAWFAGYVPYDDPKLVFVVLAENVSGHGGEVCAPLVRTFLEEYNRIVDRRRLARAGG